MQADSVSPTWRSKEVSDLATFIKYFALEEFSELEDNKIEIKTFSPNSLFTRGKTDITNQARIMKFTFPTFDWLMKILFI